MYLLDTNVVSALRRRGKMASQALRWLNSTPAAQLYISAMTVFEIQHGIVQLSRKSATGAADIQEWLDDQVLVSFSRRILAIDERIACRGAKLHVGRSRIDHDRILAATAMVHDLTVATRNTSDFAAFGVRLLDPFQP